MREAPFVVEMPATPTRDPDDGSSTARLPGHVSYRLQVSPVPAYLVASGPDAVIAQFTKVARRAGSVAREQRFDVGDLHGLELDATADGVDVFLAYLPAGRWHAQLTAIYPTGLLDDAAARRFLRSIRVEGLGAPAAGSWECDALLATMCKECGDASPTCKGKLVGQTRDACAVEATTRLALPPDLRDQECKRVARAGKLDLSGLKDAVFRPDTVQAP